MGGDERLLAANANSRFLPLGVHCVRVPPTLTSVLNPPLALSGGCTVAAHGLFLQSGLQPQMVLTTGQDAAVFHVVSRNEGPGMVLFSKLKSISQLNIDNVDTKVNIAVKSIQVLHHPGIAVSLSGILLQLPHSFSLSLSFPLSLSHC